MPDSDVSQLLALIATGAAALYLYTAVRQLLRLEKREDTLSKAVLVPGLIALALHGYVIYAGATSVSASFGFYKVASITFWLMGVLSVLYVLGSQRFVFFDTTSRTVSVGALTSRTL